MAKRAAERFGSMTGLLSALIAQFYYVMAGQGIASLAGRVQKSAAIHAGDAIPIKLSEIH